MCTALHDPPFRAEHIGSLLRPEALKALRAQYAAGLVSDEVLHAAEDAAIREAIGMQVAVGLSSITDGEFRRHGYADSFTSDAFDGIAFKPLTTKNMTFTDPTGKQSPGRLPVVEDRLVWKGSPNVDKLRFIAENAPAGVPKMTIPGPCYIHFRCGREHISRQAYPDLDLFWQDIVEAYAQEMHALSDAGCRYLQLDETALAKFGDPKIRQSLADRGDDWQDVVETYTDVINAVVARAPAGMHVGMHLCRGNMAGTWQAEGGYDEVAAKLFRKLTVRTYFLEYDTPRAGSFAPLREVPDDKTVVLGLISTKTPTLETRDTLRRRIDEAAQHVDIDRLGISPQCGFASIEYGNALTQADQEAKLRRVVEMAQEVWGYRPAAG